MLVLKIHSDKCIRIVTKSGEEILIALLPKWKVGIQADREVLIERIDNPNNKKEGDKDGNV